jgi:hypothetical protein
MAALPIAYDRRVVASRFDDPQVRSHYARAGIDLDRLLRQFLTDPGRFTPDFDRGALVDVSTDLFPRDEYDLTPP